LRRFNPSRRRPSVFQLSIQQQLSGEHYHFVGASTPLLIHVKTRHGKFPHFD
jgi:hypothetical protein